MLTKSSESFHCRGLYTAFVLSEFCQCTVHTKFVHSASIILTCQHVQTDLGLIRQKHVLSKTEEMKFRKT